MAGDLRPPGKGPLPAYSHRCYHDTIIYGEKEGSVLAWREVGRIADGADVKLVSLVWLWRCVGEKISPAPRMFSGQAVVWIYSILSRCKVV
ncbi:MAG: hypothetical protein ACLRVB_11975 [Blautia sp.]